MAKVLSVCYVGQDDNYWQNMKARFSSFKSDLYEFKFYNIRYVKGKKSCNTLFVEILSLMPDLLYFDFSLNTPEMLYLAKLANQDHTLLKVPKIGLLDYLTPMNVREEVMFAGIAISHVKSGGEVHDAAFDALYLYNTEKCKPHGFCTAVLEDQMTLEQICRLQMVKETYIRIEGDFNLTPGQEVRVDSFLRNDNLVPSQIYKVSSVAKEKMEYDYSTSADLMITFIDPPSEEDLKPKSADEAKDIDKYVRQIKSEWEHNIKQIKKTYTQWLTYEQSDASIDRTRVLVVDRELNIFRQEPKQLDSFGWNMRCTRNLIKFEEEILHFRPDLICFQYEVVKMPELATPPADPKAAAPAKGAATPTKDGKTKETKAEFNPTDFNSIESLQQLAVHIKKMKDYNPKILVFNNLVHKSEMLQKELGLTKVEVVTKPLDAAAIKSSIEEYDKKRKAEMATAKKAGGNVRQANSSKEQMYVIFKQTDLKRTKAKLLRSVNLVNASESDVLIYCKEPLELMTVHRLKIKQQEMLITLVPMPSKEKEKYKENYYRGLIHSIGELEKKELRKFVNSVFFRKKEEEKAKELESFKQLNDTKKAGESKAAPATPSPTPTPTPKKAA